MFVLCIIFNMAAQRVKILMKFRENRHEQKKEIPLVSGGNQ